MRELTILNPSERGRRGGEGSVGEGRGGECRGGERALQCAGSLKGGGGAHSTVPLTCSSPALLGGWCSLCGQCSRYASWTPSRNLALGNVKCTHITAIYTCTVAVTHSLVYSLCSSCTYMLAALLEWVQIKMVVFSSRRESSMMHSRRVRVLPQPNGPRTREGI